MPLIVDLMGVLRFMGSFFIFPFLIFGSQFIQFGDDLSVSLDSSAIYTYKSNLYRNSTNISETVYTISPGFVTQLGKQGVGLDLKWKLAPELLRYHHFSRLNTNLFKTNLVSNYILASMKFNFAYNFAETQVANSDIDDLNRNPNFEDLIETDMESIDFRYNYDISPKLAFSTSYLYNSSKFQTFDDQFADKKLINIPIEFIYKISQKLSLVAGFDRGRRTMGETNIRSGFIPNYEDLNNNQVYDVGYDLFDPNLGDRTNGLWDDEILATESYVNTLLINDPNSTVVVGDQLAPAEPFVDDNNNQVYDFGEAFTDLPNGIWDSGDQRIFPRALNNSSRLLDTNFYKIGFKGEISPKLKGEFFIGYRNNRSRSSTLEVPIGYDTYNGVWDAERVANQVDVDNGFAENIGDIIPEEEYIDINSNGQYDEAILATQADVDSGLAISVGDVLEPAEPFNDTTVQNTSRVPYSPTFPARDSLGLSGRLTYQLTPKITSRINLIKEFDASGSAEDFNTETISINNQFRINPQLIVAINYNYGSKNFYNSGRTDETSGASLAFDYHPDENQKYALGYYFVDGRAHTSTYQAREFRISGAFKY